MQHFNDDAFHRLIYTESHDEVSLAPDKQRISELFDRAHATPYRAQKLSTLGAAVFLTAPGYPCSSWVRSFLSAIRGPIGRYLTGQRQEHSAGYARYTATSIRLRRNWLNNTGGLLGQNVHVNHSNSNGNDKVVAYRRWGNRGQGDDTLVIVNFANRSFDNYHLGFPQQDSIRSYFSWTNSIVVGSLLVSVLFTNAACLSTASYPVPHVAHQYAQQAFMHLLEGFQVCPQVLTVDSHSKFEISRSHLRLQSQQMTEREPAVSDSIAWLLAE
ncbi:hypothetical protein LTR17_026040 [Elasticomyces elasticus]|nr:hypothetical protein LTR17_026040 [Elasticomyces elasticus]